MTRRRIVWMCHPVAGDVQANLVRAKRWLRWLYSKFDDVDFAADWIVCCEVMEDADPAQRERGFRFDEEMVRRCDEVWLVGGRISSGMAREAAMGRAHDKGIRDLTSLGEEPPSDVEFERAIRRRMIDQVHFVAAPVLP